VTHLNGKNVSWSSHENASEYWLRPTRKLGKINMR
jgi:hypothetical protein